MFRTSNHSADQIGAVWRLWLPVCLVAAPPLAVALGFDIHRPFETTPDGDFWFVYESLRFNGGLQQIKTDHTGYVIFVFVAWWFELLHLFGALSAHATNDFPPPNSPDFIPAYAEAVFAARYFVVLLSAGMAVIFFAFLRLLTNDIRISVVIGIIFASTVSMSDFSLFIRTDQPAFACLMMVFIFLALSARAQSPARLVGYMFACGFFSVLALLAKVTTGPALLTLPVIAWFFGEPEASRRVRTASQGFEKNSVTLFLITAAAFAVPAGHMIVTSIFHVGKGGYYQKIVEASPQVVSGGIYQAAIVIYVAAAMVIYAHHFRTGNRTLVIAGSALVIGIASGCYTTYLYPPLHTNMNAISNFIDNLYFGVSLDATFGKGKGNFSWSLILDRLLVAAHYQFQNGILGLNIRSFLNPVLIVGCLSAWKQGATSTALRAIILLAASLAIETILSIHGIDTRYAIFIVFWKLVALAILARWFLDTYGVRALNMALAAVAVPLLAINVSTLDNLQNMSAEREPKAICSYSRHMIPEFRAGFDVYCVQGPEATSANKGRSSAK